MGKVRVPKELRPPERFKPFRDPTNPHFGSIFHGPFRVTGKFREPKDGEFYWSHFAKGMAVLVRVGKGTRTGPRVILEKVEDQP